MPEDKMFSNSDKKKKKKRRRKAATAPNCPPENTETSETSRSGSPVQGCTPTRESLRWEGALEDPVAEEKRLELYRTNRRQRYVSHREALFREGQCEWTGSDEQEQRLT